MVGVAVLKRSGAAESGATRSIRHSLGGALRELMVVCEPAGAWVGVGLDVPACGSPGDGKVVDD